MRIAIPIVKASDDKTHWLSVEKNDDDTVIILIDDVEIGMTDYENIDELITAIGLVWSKWQRTEKKEAKS